MKDEDKTGEQLVAELAELCQRIAELEVSGAEHKRVRDTGEPVLFHAKPFEFS